jgi:hypothetical protein
VTFSTSVAAANAASTPVSTATATILNFSDFSKRMDGAAAVPVPPCSQLAAGGGLRISGRKGGHLAALASEFCSPCPRHPTDGAM